jgi:hypothetical protein
MRNKAQITLEAILIIAFFVLVLVAVSFPMSFKVSEAGRDVSRVLEIRNNLEKVVSAIKVVQALGPGAVRTVTITSDSKRWALATGDPVTGSSISYWIAWEEKKRIPAELAYTTTFDASRHFGGMGRNISGINADAFNYIYFDGDGKGSFEVRVENTNSAGVESRILISRSGSTINITLAP